MAYNPYQINQSVSGNVGIVGNPSISGTVNVAGNPSISGAVVVGTAFTASDSAGPNAWQFGVGTTGFAAAIPFVFNGTNYDRLRGNSSIGALVNMGAGSVITVAQSSIAVAIVSGSIAASFTPPANQSVSGAVSVSNFPTTQNVSGSVVATQGTSPWIITGSVQGSFTPSGNQSVSGTVGASVIGQVPVIPGSYATDKTVLTASPVLVPAGGTYHSSVNTYLDNQAVVTQYDVNGNLKTTLATLIAGEDITNNVLRVSIVGGISSASVIGTVPVTQTTSPWIITGSVQATVNTGNSSVQLLTGTAMIGSVAAYQGAIPWTISSVYGNISGSVVAFQGGARTTSTVGAVSVFQLTSPWIVAGNVTGSVLSLQSGGYTNSIVGGASVFQYGTWSPSAISYLLRNDTLASTLGADLTYHTQASDSAGRTVIKPFASEDATIISYVGSIVSGSVQLIQASVIGKKSYITDFWLSNTGGATTLVTFQGGDTSLVGQFIAPTGGGMAATGINIPLKNTASQDLAFKVSPSTSVLYVTIKGYVAP